MRILFGILNWGLGHATRSFQIIHSLKENGHEVIIASDGLAGQWLMAAFPDLKYCALPGYNIEYTGKALWWSMLKQSPKMLVSIQNERRKTKVLIEELGAIDYVISDSRFGCYSKTIPSILISHQLKLLGQSQFLNKMANFQLNKWAKPFAKIWIPDVDEKNNLTGSMSKLTSHKTDFIGSLSSVQKQENLEISKKLLLLLSGPEPARTVFENKLAALLKGFEESITIIRGTKNRAKNEWPLQASVIDFADRTMVSKALQTHKLILCRSGYSTIMDLTKLGLPAIFVPTPGQPEQLYLAKRMHKNNKGVFLSEEDMNVESIQAAFNSLNELPKIEVLAAENRTKRYFEEKLRSIT